MAQELGYTQQEIADKVGKDRASVSNYMRLLKLPQAIQDALGDGSLSMGHAKAILALEDAEAQLAAFREITDKGLSVRGSEKLANKLKERPPRVQKSLEDPDLHALQEDLLKALGTKVLITGNRNKGALKIFYFSLDDLNRIYERIKGASR